MQVDLTDKVALVTGSARRVGKVIALELAKHGVNILVHYHHAEPAEVRETLQEIKSLGVDAFGVAADISRAEDVDRLFEALEERYGRLDIVVNSASVFQRRDLLDVSLEDWDSDYGGKFARALFDHAAGGASDGDETRFQAASSSISAIKAPMGPWKARPHHGISKAALWMLTQVSALSLGPAIRVNAIVPGPVMKPAGRETSGEDWAKKGERSALRRTGQRRRCRARRGLLVPRRLHHRCAAAR